MADLANIKELGYWSAWDCYIWQNNPYTPNTPERKSWFIGWKEGDREVREDIKKTRDPEACDK